MKVIDGDTLKILKEFTNEEVAIEFACSLRPTSNVYIEIMKPYEQTRKYFLEQKEKERKQKQD